MTQAFTAAPGILDTTKNVLNFMKVNTGMFWYYLKPFLPYLIVANLIGLGAKLAGVMVGEGGSDLGDIIAAFFISCFMITWHRFVMLGASRTVLVNPLMLKRHEWQYVIAAVIMGLFVTAIKMTGLLTGFLPALIVSLLALALTGLVIWGIVRYSLYFPGKAINAHITPAQAVTLSQPYFWGIAGSYVLVTALLFVPMYIVALLLTVIAAMFAGLGATAGMVAQHIIMMPVDVVLVPMLAVGAATVLSNYYMLATGHKG